MGAKEILVAHECANKLGEMTGIKTVRGFIASPLDMEVELVKMALAFDVGKEHQKYGEVYDELVKICGMHTRDEIKQLATKFINEFVDEFGHNALKVMYELYFKTLANKAYLMKYGKIIYEYGKWANQWAEKYFQYNMEAFIFGAEVIKQTKYYGLFIVDFGDSYNHKLLEDIFEIVEEIRFDYYDKDIIEQHKEKLEELLQYWGHPYYCKSDLSNPEILKELFYELGEALGEREAFLGHEIFYDYDGYGNILNHKGEIYKLL